MARLRGPLVPAALAAAAAAAYLLVAPPSADLAAATFRSDLFAREGFAVWNLQWYGGHHLPGYSVLFGPLGALLGPRGAGAVGAVLAAGLFAALAHGHWGARARLGAAWFALGTASVLLSGRLTFALGLAPAIGALLALARRRTVLAGALGVLTALCSPVAALFLALAGAATRRRAGLALAVAALAPVAVLALVFPEGGTEPFAVSAFWPLLLVAPAAALLLPGERTLVTGAALLTALGIVLFAVPNPVGGNVARLAPLVAGPIAACALIDRRPRLLAVLALPLLAWQFSAGIRDVATAAGDPSVHERYHAPLVAFLERRPGPPPRIEIPFTRNHWEAAWVARDVPLARGWERQLDRKVNGLFYGGRLTPARYARWLRAGGVTWVALPDAELDASARAEASIIRASPPFLVPAWRSRHWRVWRVRGAPGIAPAPARLAAAGPDRLTLAFPRPGAAVLRTRWTPYWFARGACVSRARGDRTRVEAARAGTVVLETRFSVTRVRSAARRCG